MVTPGGEQTKLKKEVQSCLVVSLKRVYLERELQVEGIVFVHNVLSF